MAVHATLLVALGCWVLHIGTEAAGPQLIASTDSAPSATDLALVSTRLNLDEARPSTESLAMPQLAPQFEAPPAQFDPWQTAIDPIFNPLSGLDLSGYSESLAQTSSDDGGAAGKPGKGKGASFFGSVAYGKSFVFVLDVSGSMGDDLRYLAASEELLASIDELNEEQWFYVLLFSNATRAMYDMPLAQVGMVPANSVQKERLAQWLRSVNPTGGTDPREALASAIALRPDAIFLLSDGEFRGSPGQNFGNRMAAIAQISTQTINLVAATNVNKTPIHTIAFVDPIGQAAMQRLAEISGGTYRFVPNARAFRSALSKQ